MVEGQELIRSSGRHFGGVGRPRGGLVVGNDLPKLMVYPGPHRAAPQHQ